MRRERAERRATTGADGLDRPHVDPGRPVTCFEVVPGGVSAIPGRPAAVGPVRPPPQGTVPRLCCVENVLTYLFIYSRTVCTQYG